MVEFTLNKKPIAGQFGVTIFASAHISGLGIPYWARPYEIPSSRMSTPTNPKILGKSVAANQDVSVDLRVWRLALRS